MQTSVHALHQQYIFQNFSYLLNVQLAQAEFARLNHTFASIGRVVTISIRCGAALYKLCQKAQQHFQMIYSHTYQLCLFLYSEKTVLNHDYKVQRVQELLNVCQIYLSSVKVSSCHITPMNQSQGLFLMEHFQTWHTHTHTHINTHKHTLNRFMG